MEEIYQVCVWVAHHFGQHVHQQSLVLKDRLERDPAQLLKAVAVDVREVLDLKLLDEGLVGVAQVHPSDDRVNFSTIVMLVLLLYLLLYFGLRSCISFENVL